MTTRELPGRITDTYQGRGTRELPGSIGINPIDRLSDTVRVEALDSLIATREEILYQGSGGLTDRRISDTVEAC